MWAPTPTLLTPFVALGPLVRGQVLLVEQAHGHADAAQLDVHVCRHGSGLRVNDAAGYSRASSSSSLSCSTAVPSSFAAVARVEVSLIVPSPTPVAHRISRWRRLSS